MIRIRRAAALAALLFAAIASGAALAQTRPTHTAAAPGVHSMLWVGNSFFYYNNSMHNHFGLLVRDAEAGAKSRNVSVTISGSGLDWHDLASYFRPGGIGRYSFVAGNQIRFNPPGKQFDAVLMMDCSQCPIHPQLKEAFYETVKKDAAIARENGALPVLFMSWAYKDKPAMTAELAEAYTRAGNENDALVVPAGLAFARAIAARPDLEFYQPDKRHPTLIGTYLAAATVYATLYRKSPVGDPYTAGIDPETVKFLQTVAWETVKAYFGN